MLQHMGFGTRRTVGNELVGSQLPQARVHRAQLRLGPGHRDTRPRRHRLADQPQHIGQLLRHVEVEGDLGHAFLAAVGLARAAPALAATLTGALPGLLRAAVLTGALAAGWCASCWAWLSRYSSNRPTGRPVAPLALPLFQAVPAMSRWAQGNLPAKRCRNLAAVTAPPARPATLATSAKLLLRPSA